MTGGVPVSGHGGEDGIVMLLGDYTSYSLGDEVAMYNCSFS